MNGKYERHDGRFTRVFWSRRGGFGFLLDIRTGTDYFAHKRDVILEPGDTTLPQPGEFCTFEVGQFNGKDVAIMVRKAVQS